MTTRHREVEMRMKMWLIRCRVAGCGCLYFCFVCSPTVCPSRLFLMGCSIVLQGSDK
jgi:hypothetical protein